MTEIAQDRLREIEPDAMDMIHDFLAQYPDAYGDLNNRKLDKAIRKIALASIREGHEPPTWLAPMLRRLLSYPPELEEHNHNNQRQLDELVQVLQGMAIERREALLTMDQHSVRVLGWSLAHLSGTLTPAIAERAAWKVADLGERENGGGRWTDPHLRYHQRALFPKLGALAVAPLVNVFTEGARRKVLVIDALGETRCPEAAAPLVEYVGHSADKVRNMARIGLSRLIKEGHSSAICDAAEGQLKAKKKGLRIGAAEALSMLVSTETIIAIAAQGADAAKDLEVQRILEEIAARGEQHPDAVFCQQCQAEATPENMQYIDSFLQPLGKKRSRTAVVRNMKTWSLTDQIAGCVRLAVGDVEHYYAVSELLEEGGLVGGVDALAWGTMAYIDSFPYSSYVNNLLERLERWRNEPTLDPILHTLKKRPGYRLAIYEYLATRLFLTSNAQVREAWVSGLADTSKPIVKLCRELLEFAGEKARPELEAALPNAPKAMHAHISKLLAAIPSSTEQSAIPPTRKKKIAPTSTHPAPPVTHLEGTLPHFFPEHKSWVSLYFFRPTTPEGEEQPDTIVALSNPKEEQLGELKSIQNIEYLDLSNGGKSHQLTAAGAAMIGEHSSLRWLELAMDGSYSKDRPWLQDKDLPAFQDLKQLEVLLLRQQMGLTSLQHMPPLPALQVLSTSGSPMKLNAKGIKALQQLPALQSLILDAEFGPSCSYYKNTRLNDKMLAMLADLPDLKHLSLAHCEKLKGAGFEALRDHPQLGWLDLTACFKLQNVETMAHIAQMPALRILDLGELLGIETPMLEVLSDSRSLTSLQVDTLYLDDISIRAICQIKSLKTLSLRSSTLWKEAGSKIPLFSDDVYAMLASLPHLETLRIEDTMWNWKRLDCVIGLPIKHLLISPGRQLSKDEYMLLAEMKGLESLHINYDQLEVVPALQEAMPGCAVSSSYHALRTHPGDKGVPISMS